MHLCFIEATCTTITVFPTIYSTTITWLFIVIIPTTHGISMYQYCNNNNYYHYCNEDNIEIVNYIS